MRRQHAAAGLTEVARGAIARVPGCGGAITLWPDPSRQAAIWTG